MSDRPGKRTKIKNAMQYNIGVNFGLNIRHV